MADFFPPAFLHPARKQDVIDWLAQLPLDPQDKKRALLDWAAKTGAQLTGAEVRAAIPGLARDEGEVA